jgi:1,4-alpha-glucan branching enzyme
MLPEFSIATLFRIAQAQINLLHYYYYLDMSQIWKMKIGTAYLGNGRCEFNVWAPFLSEMSVQIIAPEKRLMPMQRYGRGYWQVTATDIFPGTVYLYKLEDGTLRPDPASQFQPQGVHNPSQVVDHSSFIWDDGDWSGIPLEEMIVYELHVGTFTPEGTFLAIIPRLDQLLFVGINAIELMPVAQFPGERNWGYDGVYPFAVQNSYGGVEGLKQLVNACHQKGMAVILDVVYNHFGPEGNYTSNFGPYFTNKYQNKIIFLRRWSQDSQVFCVMNFGEQEATLKVELPRGNWQKRLDSSDSQWLGNGSILPQRLTQDQDLTIQPQSFALYEMK